MINMHASNSQPFLHKFEVPPAHSQRTMPLAGLQGNSGGRSEEANKKYKFGTVKHLKIFSSQEDRDNTKELIKSMVSSAKSQRLDNIKLNTLPVKQDGTASQKNLKNAGVLKLRSSQTAYTKKIEKIRTTFLYSGNYLLKFPWEYNFNERKAREKNQDLIKQGEKIYFSSEVNGELKPISMDFLQREIKGELRERYNTTKENTSSNVSLEKKIQQHKLEDYKYDGIAQSISDKLRSSPRCPPDHRESSNGFVVCKQCKKKEKALVEAENKLFERGEYIKKLEEQIDYCKAIAGSKSIKTLLDEEINNFKSLLGKREKAAVKSMKEVDKYRDVLDYLKYCNLGNEKESAFVDFTHHYIQIEKDIAELRKENERLLYKLNVSKRGAAYLDMKKSQRVGSTLEQTYSQFSNESKSFHNPRSVNEELDDYMDELNNYFERLEFCVFSIERSLQKQSERDKGPYPDDNQKYENFRFSIEGIKGNIAKEFSLLLQELERVKVK